jgi:hypothetical protein
LKLLKIRNTVNLKGLCQARLEWRHQSGVVG